jgi:thiosulfate/3-mercaptopyruvate sulfurtransferase
MVEESNYTVHLVPWLLVNESRLESLLQQPQVQILDARDFADYGRSRLTNASIPMVAEKLYDDLLIKDVVTLKELMERRSLEKDYTQLVYGTPEAYSLFFGLKLMGYNATLLEGDWWQKTEWAVSNVR